MVLQFSIAQDRRREVKEERPAPAQAEESRLAPAHAALAACRAELLAIARSATLLAQLESRAPKRKAPAGGDLGTGA